MLLDSFTWRYWTVSPDVTERFYLSLLNLWVVGSGDGAGKLPVPGVLLLWHMVGQGPAVLATAEGRVGCFFFIFFFISSILSPFSNASSLGRRLDILKYCGLGRYKPTVVVSYYWRRAR